MCLPLLPNLRMAKGHLKHRPSPARRTMKTRLILRLSISTRSCLTTIPPWPRDLCQRRSRPLQLTLHNRTCLARRELVQRSRKTKPLKRPCLRCTGRDTGRPFITLVLAYPSHSSHSWHFRLVVKVDRSRRTASMMGSMKRRKRRMQSAAKMPIWMSWSRHNGDVA